jgi:hypothetical protein
MIGLAAIAAVAAMAFLGASTASASQATLLCSNNTPTLTPSAEECGVVKHIHFQSVEGPEAGNSHGLLLGTVTVRCNALLLAETDDLLTAAGTPVNFNLNVNLAYTNCLSGFHVLVLQQGHVLVLKTGAELAEVTAGGFLVNVLGNGLNCDYNATALVGHGSAGPEGKGHTTYTKSNVNLVEKLGGFLPCPTAGALDVLFQSLTPLYIRS